MTWTWLSYKLKRSWSNYAKKNKSWSLEDKLAILKENLVEGKSVADICEANGLSPSLFYTWREALFKPNVSANKKCNQRKEISKIKALEDRLAKSEAKIMLKNEVIAELLEEYSKVKKVLDLRRFGMDWASCAR